MLSKHKQREKSSEEVIKDMSEIDVSTKLGQQDGFSKGADSVIKNRR